MARLLVTADWHIRGDAPVCRVNPDEWLSDQAKSIEQLIPIVDKEHCDEMWVMGDIFHRSRTSTEATVQALALLSKFTIPVRVLPGNHDLNAHAYGNLDKSTIGAIYALEHVHELKSHGTSPIVSAYAFGTEPETIPHCDIWCLHSLVFPDNDSRPLPNIGIIAEELLPFTDAKVILTGDYHHGYVREFGDRKVITPGCINIQASDMDGYQPKCYILDTDDFSVKEIALETFGKVHKDPMRESRQELETYLEGLQDFEVPHLDYIANVREALIKEQQGVQDAVNDVLDAYNPEKA